MAQIQKVIEQLGYSSNEAKVYLCALGLGECHVSDIAAKLKMPLSSVQAIVDKLHKNGVINFYVKNRYKYWVAESPEKLLTQLQQREEAVREAMPMLSALRKKTSSMAQKPAVSVYTGRDEIKQILDDIIATQHPIFAILPEDALLNLFEGTTIFEDFTEARVRHFLSIRVLATDTPRSRRMAEAGSKELREMRFLPAHANVESASLMYGGKVALIMFNQKQPTAVLIEDSGIYTTELILFEEVWERSTSR